MHEVKRKRKSSPLAGILSAMAFNVTHAAAAWMWWIPARTFAVAASVGIV
jgi:hypothetical protein